MRQFMPWMVIFSMLLLIGSGCGGGGEQKQENAPAPETPSTETASPEMQKSAAVVREFITAILKGYDEQAFALLSQKAQSEYKRMGRELGFPANDQTEFIIDGVAPIPESNNELFGVAVTMKEPEGNEIKITQSSWGVRNEGKRFSIIGVVLSDDGMTMELNFEDLAATDAKMQQLQEQQMQAQETIATAPQGYNMPLPPVGTTTPPPLPPLPNGETPQMPVPDIQLPSQQVIR